MKAIITIINLLTLASTANAMIFNSQLEYRHQSEIELAIGSRCGIYGTLTSYSEEKYEHKIDNGITDVYYMTHIKAQQGIDQYETDKFDIVVQSFFSDNYDHNSLNWGTYTVFDVQCMKTN